MFYGEVAPDTSECWCNIEIKKVKATSNVQYSQHIVLTQYNKARYYTVVLILDNTTLSNSFTDSNSTYPHLTKIIINFSGL